MSLSKRQKIRVLQIEKISIASYKDVVVLTQFSRHAQVGYIQMKNQRAGNYLSLFERRGNPVRVPTRKHLKTFVNV